MIHHVEGNIFLSPAQYIVNPVNCVGVMGKGLASQFKNRYPYVFQEYARLCKAGKLRPGVLHYVKLSYGDKYVINFPTKNDWRRPSELEYIEQGLIRFVKNYKKRGIKSVAFPPLGAGLDGLEWSDVLPLMIKHLEPLDIDVYIYAPSK